MAQPFRQTNITLEEEAMPGSTVEAAQEKKRREQAGKNVRVSPKELKQMTPKKAKETITRLLDRSTQQLNELIEAKANQLAGFEAETKALTEKIEAENVAIEAETKAANAAMAEADENLVTLVTAGIIPYNSLPPVLQGTVNKSTQYNYSASDAAVTALLRSIGVTGISDAMRQIRALYPDISSDDALMLAKFDPRFNSAYMTRFAGNKLLMDSGFAPLDDKDYLATESAFDKIFTSYELKQFNNRERYAKLIGNRISADELASRVSLAADRVMKGAAETRKALAQLYPELTNADLIGYAIDPVNQLPALQRKVLSAEIGGTALAQNLSIGLTAAPTEKTGFTNVQRTGLGVEELMASGVDLEQARTGFAKVAEVLPTAEKLSALYGSRMEQFGRKEAEQEEFQKLASAKRARQRLTQEELAQFSGEAGYGRIRKQTGGLI